MKSALHYSHDLLDQLITRFPNQTFVDATLGNGHDITYVLTHPHFNGQAIGFDIQDLAIENTSERIKQQVPEINPNDYRLIQDSHAHIGDYIQDDEQIAGAIFNLGYLPGGDHDITTTYDSTIQAIQTIGDHLLPHGQIILVVYHGHPQGKVESQALLDSVSSLPQEDWQVLTYQFINQRNYPPYLIIIEKRK